MRLLLPLMCALCALGANTACAQAAWPGREVKIIIGFSAGGTTDIITRTLAPELTRAWGQAIVIENRTGAGGNIGAELVAKARPDGYTLFMGSVGPLAVNASLYKAMPFDNLKDLSPISFVADVPNMLVFNPKAMPAANFGEFLTLVKANPGKYFFGSTGSGTTSHLSGELLRAVAVTSLKRSAGVPEVPTIAESGFPGFDASSWFGLVGPAGLPREIAAKIASDIARILKQTDMRERFVAQGADPVGSTPEQFGLHMQNETAKWARLVKASGAKAD